MLQHIWTEMYNDTWMGLLYGALFIPTVIFLVPAVCWLGLKLINLVVDAAMVGADVAGKAARVIHKPDGKG